MVEKLKEETIKKARAIEEVIREVENFEPLEKTNYLGLIMKWQKKLR